MQNVHRGGIVESRISARIRITFWMHAQCESILAVCEEETEQKKAAQTLSFTEMVCPWEIAYLTPKIPICSGYILYVSNHLIYECPEQTI